MVEFKRGDFVYCPYLGTKVYGVKFDRDPSTAYPIELDNGNDSETFTVNGLIVQDKELPQVFLATKENQKALEALFGVKFEEPPATDCLAACLAELPVMCSVSDKSVEDAKLQIRPRLIISTSAEINHLEPDPKYKFKFIDSEGVIWKFAVLFDVEKFIQG